jgi:thiosulfate/3-mercaptopyruvate sulfurtransferase
MIRILVAAAIFSVSAPACAQHSAGSFLVSPPWLKERLRDPSLVLLHVGERQEYDSTHIPGAQFIRATDISIAKNGLTMELPPAQQLDSLLEQFGISQTSTVVVYFGKDWVSPTTRVMFTLEAAGLHPYLLDGGMPAWIQAGGDVTNRLPTVRRGKLPRVPEKDMTVSGEWVRSHLNANGVVVVDGRSHDFYDGTNDAHGRITRPGHIAGAKNISFDSVVRENNVMKSPEELRSMFQAQGVQPGDTVVTYCHIGQQATLVLTAARLAGYTVRLYDGSYQDWQNHSDFPVVTGPQPNSGH